MRRSRECLFRACVVLSLVLAVVAVPAPGYSQTRSKTAIKFTGKEIYDPQNGFGVFLKGTMPFITVSSSRHQYALLLPYSETWELESGPERPLFAREGRYIASVMIGSAPIKTPLEYYAKFLDNMKKSGAYETRNVEILNPNTEKPLLRYETRLTNVPEAASDMNRWSWEYWVAVQHRSKWYAFHLSRHTEEEVSFWEEMEMRFALDSFAPGIVVRD